VEVSLALEAGASGTVEVGDALAASSAKAGVRKKDPRKSVAAKRTTNLILSLLNTTAK
jgi:hypothetical protein